MVDTVEGLYQKIESWMEEKKVVLTFDKLRDLEFEYDKIYCWFDGNFEERLNNIA